MFPEVAGGGLPCSCLDLEGDGAFTPDTLKFNPTLFPQVGAAPDGLGAFGGCVALRIHPTVGRPEWCCSRLTGPKAMMPEPG